MAVSINPRLTEITISGIRQFSNQLVHYPDAINLTIGQPDFPTPDEVKEGAIRAITENKTGYSHNAGLIDLRHTVNEFFTNKYGFSYDPESEIIITNGASQAIDIIFRTILEEGDEVILPAPIYTGYVPIIKLLGATPVFLDTTDTDFQPSAERLESLITDKTKAVLFNFPSNPTGVTIEQNQMDELAKVLSAHDVFTISDEIYSENTFFRKHCSFGEYPELRAKLFLVHGLSKSHSMTGWRIGFLMADKEWMQHCIKIQQYNAICASLPSQYAAMEALTTSKDTPAEMNKEYIKRRDYVYGRLLEMGLDVVEPTGAFYMFPSIKRFNMTSFEFATRLLKEAGVAAVPGSAFTQYGEGYLRISYAYSMAHLTEGLDRMEKFINNLN